MPKGARSLNYRLCLLSCLLIGWRPDTAETETTGAKLWPRIKIGAEMYTDVVYVDHDASRVKFKHAFGIANMPISQLPTSLQKNLGYDPSKASENEAKLATEQAAIREQVEANNVAARERSNASAISTGQPEEKDGMIRVIETEVIPPDEVRRLGIAGLQRYRQPGESPIEQLERESKTGVIRKVLRWVPKPKPDSAYAGGRRVRTLKVYSARYGGKGDLTHIIEEDENGVQKVYNARYGGKGDLAQVIEDGKVYNARYGGKGDLAQVIEDGKVYNARYGGKGDLAQIIEED